MLIEEQEARIGMPPKNLSRLIRSSLFAFLLQLPLLASSTIIAEAPSPSMGRHIRVSVILPDSYAVDQKRYSAICFLHGYSGDHTTWPAVAPLTRYADEYRLICVCPDGGYSSWYLDSPVKRQSQFETFIAVELVAFLDSAYRTHAVDLGRGLIGSSMGGHGALTILARHPGVFRGAASISGIMNLGDFPAEWGIAEVLGPYRANRARWQSHSFLGLARRLAGADRWIALDCGMSDFALRGNRAAHSLLTKLNVAHVYRERPGAHTPAYVRAVVGEHVAALSRMLLPPQ